MKIVDWHVGSEDLTLTRYAVTLMLPEKICLDMALRYEQVYVYGFIGAEESEEQIKRDIHRWAEEHFDWQVEYISRA